MILHSIVIKIRLDMPFFLMVAPSKAVAKGGFRGLKPPHPPRRLKKMGKKIVIL